VAVGRFGMAESGLAAFPVARTANAALAKGGPIGKIAAFGVLSTKIGTNGIGRGWPPSKTKPHSGKVSASHLLLVVSGLLINTRNTTKLFALLLSWILEDLRGCATQHAFPILAGGCYMSYAALFLWCFPFPL